ncbi:MAG: phosphatase PAP2 family protein [Candidatus Zixiibacteriota bacterium]
MKRNQTVTLYPFDRIIIGYCLLMLILILLFGQPLKNYYDELAFYSAVIVLVVLICRHVDERKNCFSTLLRIGYPGLLFTFFYRATGGTIFLIFDRFYDRQLTSFEKAIFGTYPTLYIDQHLLNVWANEIFSFCYFSYYFMILVFLLVLFVKKHYATIKSFLTSACLTFFFSYILFFIYPIEGPRWFFAYQYVNPIESPLFRNLVEFVIDNAAVHGGCMPSSHFGVALVIQMYCFRYYKLSAWLLLPLNLGLAIGTVWGRFHYVSDVIVGGLLGIVTTFFVWKYYPKWYPSGVSSVAQKELQAEHVS